MSKKPDKPDKLRAAAEAELSHVPALAQQARPAEELLHELQVYQIELEMQNEELRRAQLALEESRDRYMDLYEFAPVCYLTLAREGTISEINLTGASLLGVERKKLLRRSFGSFVIPEQRDRWNRLFADMLQQREAKSCELTLETGAGERIYAKLNCKRNGNSGEPPVVRITLSNNTELNLAVADVIKERIKLYTLFDSIPDAIFITDMEGRFLQVNHSACERLGYSLEELLQMGPADIDAPEYAAKVPERIKALQERGELVFESMHVRKDGAVIPIELSNRLVDYDGKPVIIGVARDISKRKQAERALQQSEEKWRNLFQILPVGVSIVDSKRAVAENNPPLESILKISRQGLHNGEYKNWKYLRSDGTPLPLEEIPSVRALQEGRIIKDVEIGVVKEDGAVIWTNVSAAPLSLQNGQCVTVTMDITKRKQVEESLLASEMKFSHIFNKAAFAIALSRLPNGEFADVNEAWMQLFGYAREEAIGKTQSELGINMNFDSRTNIIDELQQQGSVRNVESTLMTKHGDARIFMVNMDMIDIGGQKFALTTLKDITERKASEQQLRELTAHLLTVREEEKADIAREIHDDLGGTLTAIKMEAYWLAEELSASNEAEPLLKHVEQISHLTENAVNVTRRVITGLRPTVLDDLGLLAALEWQAEQFRKHTGIACRVNSIEDKIKLDRQYSIALFRIFQEALTNVARHSGATRVEVEFQSSDEGVMLSVSDDGRGLPEGYTVSPTSYGVRGMRERVEQLGGKIKFESPPGGGFNVTVTLLLPAEIRMESKA